MKEEKDKWYELEIVEFGCRKCNGDPQRIHFSPEYSQLECLVCGWRGHLEDDEFEIKLYDIEEA